MSSFAFLAVIYIASFLFFVFLRPRLLPVLSCYASAFSHSFFHSITSHVCHIPIFPALPWTSSLPPSPYLNFLAPTVFSFLPPLMSLFSFLFFSFSGQLFLSHFQHRPFLLFHHHRLILSTPCPPLIPHPHSILSLPSSSLSPSLHPVHSPGEVSNNGSDGVREGGAIIVLSGVRGIDRPRNMRREKEPLCQIQ